MISDADLLAYIRPASEDELETIRRLERGAVALVQKKTGRYYGVSGVRTEVVQRNSSLMQLSNVPLNGITTLESWDGSAWSEVDATSYYTDGAYIRFYSTTSWSPLTSPTRYRATYNAGGVDLGGDEWEADENIKQAVLIYVTGWYENRTGEDWEQIERAAYSLIEPDVKVVV